LLIGQKEGTDSDIYAIDLNLELVVSGIGNDQCAGVGSVQVIVGGDCYWGLTNGLIVHSEGIEGQDDNVSVLVARLDNDGEVLIGASGGIGSRQDTNGEGSIFDLASFQRDFNLDGSGLVGSVRDCVSTIAIIDNISVNVRLLGSSDLDDKRIASVDSWIAFMVNGMDGELGGFVVLDFAIFNTFSVGIRSVGGA